MDPQIKSLSTTAIGYLAAMIATWAAAHGLIGANEQVNATAALVTLIGYSVAAVIAEYKRRQGAPAALVADAAKTPEGQNAMIKKINDAPNGVTVVSTENAVAAGIFPVHASLK